MNINEIARHVAEEVLEGVIGRVAGDLDYLCEIGRMVGLAGDGDHLEIGMLFGGTAVTAALVKKRLEHSGHVVGVDPLDGYNMGVINDQGQLVETRMDPVCRNLVPNLEIVQRNAEKFGVELEIIPKKSYPWPTELETRSFVSAYIDGDHYNEGPMRDWLNVKNRVSGIVLFDDCRPRYPGIWRARGAAIADPDWEFFVGNDRLFAVRKVVNA